MLTFSQSQLSMFKIIVCLMRNVGLRFFRILKIAPYFLTFIVKTSPMPFLSSSLWITPFYFLEKHTVFFHFLLRFDKLTLITLVPFCNIGAPNSEAF